MTRINVSRVGFLIVLACGSAAAAQNSSPFLRPDAGAQPAATASGVCDLAYPSKVPVRCWAGQKFVVLPGFKDLRSYGYQSFAIEGGNFTQHPSYDDLAGKIVTVSDVRWVENDRIPDLSGWEIAFQADGGGPTYSASLVILPREGRDDATISEFGLLRDFEAARSKYVGQRFFSLVHELPRVGTDFTEQNNVKFPYGSALTVSDVIAGRDNATPIRLVLKNAAGDEGYIDIIGSPTNMSPELYRIASAHVIDRELSSKDPHTLHNFSSKVWTAIQNETVFIGMTAEQARMSWGTPDTVNNTILRGSRHEQWVYGSGSYLYLDNGTVSAIQN